MDINLMFLPMIFLINSSIGYKYLANNILASSIIGLAKNDKLMLFKINIVTTT